MGTEPVPPTIPTAGDEIGTLDGWVYSDDPKQGRINCEDDDCHQEHADS